MPGRGAVADTQWFVVPAGTKIAHCRSENCRKPVFFIKHPFTEKPHPIDCEVPYGRRPSSRPHDPLQAGLFDDPALVEPAYDGRGVSHFETCVDAARFRRGGIHD